MKKLFFLAIIAAFASCGTGSTTEAPTTDSTSVKTDSTTVDTTKTVTADTTKVEASTTN